MSDRNSCSRVLCGVAALLLVVLPRPAAAQSASGAMAGVVTDETGAVLPGVTVEAASPALIEGMRTAVTDGSGNYRIINLRPGPYSVTFTLSGFGTVRREGIELTTGFTATIDAELSIGAVEETVVVTAAAPIVDVQNVRTQQVLSREALDALPTAQSLQSIQALTLGAERGTHDVGGTTAEGAYQTGIHGTGGGEQQLFVDGIPINSSYGNGSGSSKSQGLNQFAVEEVTIETSGQMAESAAAGMQVNWIPKEGANVFTGTASTNWAGKGVQGSNLDDTLRARGASTETTIRKIYDMGGGFGGPIVRDRLWFYVAQRKYESSLFSAGGFFNATQGTPVYTPDLSRPAYILEDAVNTSGRVTWQMTEKQKIGFSESRNHWCTCFRGAGATASPEATWASDSEVWMTHGTWTYAANNRLLFQASAGVQLETPNALIHQAGASKTDVPLWDFALGLKYNAYITSPFSTFVIDYGKFSLNQSTSQASVSYVTGSHNFKAGFQSYYGWYPIELELNEVPGLGPVAYFMFNGFPFMISQYTSPIQYESRGLRLGMYAQDQWTIDRLTLNLGLRLDTNEQWVPDQNLSGGAFYPAVSFEAIDYVSWRDINPRAGAAYDLFGDGRTAVKASLGRYVESDLMTIAQQANPAASMVTGATRFWYDANNDFFPQETELGPLSNSAFGTVVSVRDYDPEILEGWHVRPHIWRAAASISHEVLPGWGVQASYFRTWHGNFRVTDNLLVTPEDFDPFCVTTPVDARLPSGGGEEICGLYDVTPSKFGQGSYLVMAADNFGKQTQVYNGIEVSSNLRFGDGGVVFGGVSTGKSEAESCFVIDSPQQAYQCHQEDPWAGQTQFKLAASYPLPGGVAVSGVFQMLPGTSVAAPWQVPNSLIAPSLGRNLAACGSAAVCNATHFIGVSPYDLNANANPLGGPGIVEPNAHFEKRLVQLDLRVHYTFSVGRVRVQPQLDFYNVLNSNSVLTRNDTYGPAWGNVTGFLPPRFVKFGAQVNF